MSVPSQKFQFKMHGETIVDEFSWIRSNPDKAKEYIKKENSKTELFENETNILEEQIYKELEDIENVSYCTHPIKFKSSSKYEYFECKYNDKPYSQVFRKNLENESNELILDKNQFSENLEYFKLSYRISLDDEFLILGLDTTGDEQYEIYKFNINTKQIEKLNIKNVNFFQIIISPDCNKLFWVDSDDSLRPYKLMAYDFISKQSIELFEEKDIRFTLDIRISEDNNILFVESNESEMNETRFIDLRTNNLNLTLIRPRAEKVLYFAEFRENVFFFRTNLDNPTVFTIYCSVIDNPGKWEVYIDWLKNVYFDELYVFQNFMLMLCKDKDNNFIIKYDFNTSECIQLINSKLSIYYPTHMLYDSNEILLREESFIGTDKIINFNTKMILWERPINNYNENDFEVQRIYVNSNYGEKVPVTIINKKDVDISKSHIYLYGYGAYGVVIEPEFRSSIVPLLNRNIVFAIVHPRGSGIYGSNWHIAGKKHNKMNTFFDVINAAEHFKKMGCLSVSFEGRSAGGLTAGASMVLRPDVFTSVILGVPFVDVLNTMLDKTLPLTAGEFSEWGNPEEPEYFHRILSYCPYNNLKAVDYPNTYITSGMNDPRVSYWEPVKFHAKLSKLRTDNNIHLLKINFNSGHFGLNNKFKKFKENAKKLTFYLESIKKLN